MNNIVIWTVTGGSIVFLIGLFSALSSRHESKRSAVQNRLIMRSRAAMEPIRPKEKNEQQEEMSMAASSTSASQYGGVAVGKGK